MNTVVKCDYYEDNVGLNQHHQKNMAVHFNNSHQDVGKETTRAAGRGCCPGDTRRGNGGRCGASDEDNLPFLLNLSLLILQTTSFSLKRGARVLNQT